MADSERVRVWMDWEIDSARRSTPPLAERLALLCRDALELLGQIGPNPLRFSIKKRGRDRDFTIPDELDAMRKYCSSGKVSSMNGVPRGPYTDRGMAVNATLNIFGGSWLERAFLGAKITGAPEVVDQLGSLCLASLVAVPQLGALSGTVSSGWPMFLTAASKLRVEGLKTAIPGVGWANLLTAGHLEVLGGRAKLDALAETSDEFRVMSTESEDAVIVVAVVPLSLWRYSEDTAMFAALASCVRESSREHYVWVPPKEYLDGIW